GHRLRHGPIRIGDIAEGDGARRAGRGARRRELVRLHIAVLDRGAVLGFANALHAEGALLHHTLCAHRDVRVELPVERFGERVLFAVLLAVTEPVEITNLVGTVVRAVPRADAAVVDLHVQSVGCVISRVYGTD